MYKFAIGVQAAAISEHAVIAGLDYLMPRPGEFKVQPFYFSKLPNDKLDEEELLHRCRCIAASLQESFEAENYIALGSGMIIRKAQPSKHRIRVDYLVVVYADRMIETKVLNPRQIEVQRKHKAIEATSPEVVLGLKATVSAHFRRLRLASKRLPSPR